MLCRPLIYLSFVLSTFVNCTLSVLLFTAFDYSFGIVRLLAILLSVLLFTASDYSFGIVRLLAILLSVLRFTASDYSFGIVRLLAILLSILLFTASDYSFGIFKLLTTIYCLSFYLPQYGFWLPLWYLHTFGHCIVCSSIYVLFVVTLLEFEFWCLTPLSAIFQLYHDDQF